MRISIQSLGCPKNFLDSEVMCGYLLKEGHTITNEIKESDIAIINTCSFIQPAVEESVDSILQAARLKQEGRLRFLIVAGCLSQRYNQKDLHRSLPEVDAFIGVDEISKIGEIVSYLKNEEFLFQVNTKPSYLYNEKSPRLIMTPQHYAYLKISEGCNNSCSYCLIPKIKGRYRSRPIESIVLETKELISNYPIKEIIFIGEDTTYYGKDIYGKFALADLLENLGKIPWQDDQKIRIMYTHPAHFTEKLIDLIAKSSFIHPYLDIPFQHINDKILSRMNRKTGKKIILQLINKLRKKIPNLIIRTTFIVGFPGETEEIFQELHDFINEYRFERIGVFPYYNEDTCKAASMDGQIAKKVKKNRVEKLMKLQQKIALKQQQERIGKIFKVLIDKFSDKDSSILLGRTYAEAPEIDGNIKVFKGDKDDIGKWIKVKMKKAYPYQLIGEKITKADNP